MGSGTESQRRISGTVEHAIAGADTTCHIVVVSTPSDREGEHSTSLQCCVCHIKMRTPTGSHILAGHPTTVTVVEHSVVSVLGATLYILIPTPGCDGVPEELILRSGCNRSVSELTMSRSYRERYTGAAGSPCLRGWASSAAPSL